MRSRDSDNSDRSQADADRTRTNVSRRTFTKMAAVAAGGSLLGGAGTQLGAAEAADGWDDFRNWRAIEAEHVWKRGYRGRPDRTIGLTDTGLDARHPEIGPWNGVKAFTESGELKLTKPEANDTTRVETGETESFTGTMGAGTFATGEEKYHEFTTPSDVDELDSVLSWGPVEDNDLELRFDRWTGDSWETEARAATANQPEQLPEVPVDGETKYRYVIEAWLNTDTEYEIEGTYYDVEGTFETYDNSVVFEGTDGEPTPDTPKTVGWYNESSRYGTYDRPRDPNGHGTHCSSIMGGTGRASAVDADGFDSDRPETFLSEVADGSLTYDVDVDAGAGLFGAAYGELIELRLRDPDGDVIDTSAAPNDTSTWDVNVVEEPVTASGTYTFEIGTADGEDATDAYVERTGYGPFLDPDATVADRAGGADDGVHSGLAPDQSLVCLQGLSGPTEDLGRHAAQFADTFNLRAVNMSWGYVGGLPLGAAAGTFDRIPSVIKDIAREGIITLAAAGNAATPVNGNGSPAVADEAVSVAATGPLDGISGYSSGGIGGVDEDDEDAYTKPDVTAPGGTLTDLASAAKNGDADAPESEQAPIRDMTGKAGTSMATPFTTGVTGLVAQAMEEDAPAALRLPAPTDAALEDVLRLKQVLLATATETALTAAPYHRAKTPTYDFGGRDPYEGFGRINPSAAVDAVTRELSGTTAEMVGLNLPHDERAVAGYVQASDGTVDVSVEFTGYDGADADVTAGKPHFDLFIYDGAKPDEHGDPNIVDRTAALTGEGSASASTGLETEERTFLVVVKLVDVPGGVNGDDVQANFDLRVTHKEAPNPPGRARGRRKGGDDDDELLDTLDTTTVEVTVTSEEDATVRDVIPEEWDVVDTLLSVVSDDDSAVEYVELGDVEAGEETTFTYEVTTPDELLDLPKEHRFGPVQVNAGSGWTGVPGTTGTKTTRGD